MKKGQAIEKRIELLVSELFIKANNELRPDVLSALRTAYNREKKGSPSRGMLRVLLENASIARRESMPICQDTGMAAVFVRIGIGAGLSGADIRGAVTRGVARAYDKGMFRKSVVGDPVIRKNTGDNTPAAIHIEFSSGKKIHISVMPKGFGSENKSKLIMLDPTAAPDDIADACVSVVRSAGPDACPPYVLGVGLGGTMEMSALMAKKALLRPLGKRNPKRHLAAIERTVMEKSNALGVGVMGLGGRTTVLGVNIEAGPTHIAGLPLAVNLSCHALRSASGVI
ncbi:MAG: fumarate hydratase [Candidatus Omnitrophica bacterium]|nr:fumarate hydratase [Candidatus Omnitrophota bacterium]